MERRDFLSAFGGAIVPAGLLVKEKLRTDVRKEEKVASVASSTECNTPTPTPTATPTQTPTATPTETPTPTPTPSDSSQEPYNGKDSIPGRIELEDYDTGGEGVAYHDVTSGNTPGAYRDDDVDIYDMGGGEYCIGWIRDEEWLEYTVDVTEGTFDIFLRVATGNNGGILTVTLDGREIGEIDVSDTGGWLDWETVKISSVKVDNGGEQILRIDMSRSADLSDDEDHLYNIDWIEFK